MCRMSNCPVKFTRLQSLLQLCYAMTMNKCQSQTLIGKVGLYLKDGVFSHRQLYVALLRATSFETISICYTPVQGQHKHCQLNIVCLQVTDRIINKQECLVPLYYLRSIMIQGVNPEGTLGII